jgi:hypothetical protein
VARVKDTFFMASTKAPAAAGTNGVSIVPDSITRAGNFDGQNVIFDPLNLSNGRRTPFAGNRIPQNRIDPIATNFLSRYQPLPNSTSASGNYFDATPSRSVDDRASGRVDRQFGNRGTLTGRYTINDESNRVAGSFPLLPLSEQVRAQQVSLGYTTGAARWVNETHASFTRLRVFGVPETAFQVNVAKEIRSTGPRTRSASGHHTSTSSTTVVTDRPSLPKRQRDNLCTSPTAWRWCVTVIRSRSWQSSAVSVELPWQSPAAGTITPVSSPAPMAAARPGDPRIFIFLTTSARTKGEGQAYLRQRVYAVFAQDDWRLSPRLTLNFGMRYEYASPYREARSNLLNLDYSSLPKPPSLVRTDSGSEPDRNNFGPRIGLAWQIPPKLVFRAGYGIYFNPEVAVETYDLVKNGLLNEFNQTQGDRAPVLTTRDAFFTGFPQLFRPDPRARTFLCAAVTASVQRELPDARCSARLRRVEGSRLGLSSRHLPTWRT